MIKPLIAAFLVLLSIIVLSRASHGEPIRGASFIGICSPHFPCDRALALFKSMPRGQVKAIGYLHGTFGNECQCVARFLREVRGPKYIRVHLADGTCFPERGRRCLDGSVFEGESLASANAKILAGDWAIFSRYLKAIREVQRMFRGYKNNPNIILRFSMCLECPFEISTRRILYKFARRYFSEEQMVDSTTRPECLNEPICEQHGDSPRFQTRGRCITDLDGVSIENSYLERFFQLSNQCEAAFFWTYGCNLLAENYRGSFVPPKNRTSQITDRELGAIDYCINAPQ